METPRTAYAITDAVMGIHRPDDNVNWLRVATRTVVLPDETVGVLATFTDITDLRCLAANHRFVFEYSETPAFVVHYGSRPIIGVNRALCHWLGFRRDELLGTHVHALINPADFELGTARWKQLLRSGLVEREAHYCQSDRRGRMTARAFPAMAIVPTGSLRKRWTSLQTRRRRWRPSTTCLQHRPADARCSPPGSGRCSIARDSAF